ncbi:FAD binding domain-containing protein [Humitalea sp. 24SJ18S-53]|uniref:FAD binding domain-containing protein n=1 Tax=Humitalea sp. 24SJ18S-53 TaxID=3422307 RepID=UPI003D679065
MKPPPFLHATPVTVDAALDLLAEHGDAARVLAGGQSLMPLLVMRMARPAVLLDLNRCAGLSHIILADGVLRIGAMARQIDVQRAPEVAQAAPLLAQALHFAGPRTVRNRGTFGGSMAHADPSAEAPAAALCLDAVMVLASRRGQRQVTARDFFVDALVTAIAADEMLVEVRIPATSGRTAFTEAGVRQADLAMAGIAVDLTTDDGRITRIRIAAIGAANRPTRLAGAEAALLGARPTPRLLRDAARAALADADAPSDLIAQAPHRLSVLEGLLERAVLDALAPDRIAA